MSGYPRPRGVAPVPLAELAALLRAGGTVGDGHLTPGRPVESAGVTGEITVTGITHASGSVRPGDLFAALPGEHHHGSRFIPAAAGAGAVAVLTDPAGAEAAGAAGLPALITSQPRAALGPVASRVYGDPSARLLMIGVTGTAGKTSTTYLLESGLRAAGRNPGLVGTVETRLGDLVVNSARTTPEAPDLHAILAAAVERGVDSVAMEVSSHALALGRVGGVRFAVGGFTNFGVDHLDFHADVEEYFAAKAMLFDGRCAAEVVNLDDPAGRRLVHPGTITYSASGADGATWRAMDVRGHGYAQRFTALGPDGPVPAAVALPGRHNVANALLAIAALAAAGVDPDVAAEGVAGCPGVPGRMERVGPAGPVLGVVDYAHKPDAIVAVLRALRDLGPGRLICVLGAGGDRDRSKRPLMGAAAAAGADLVVITDDNPRTEDPARIRAEVRQGAAGPAEVVEVAGRRAAIDEAVRRARPGDTVAVLGKGHERGQEVQGEVRDFDDRVELAAALLAHAPAAGGPAGGGTGAGPAGGPGTPGTAGAVGAGSGTGVAR